MRWVAIILSLLMSPVADARPQGGISDTVIVTGNFVVGYSKVPYQSFMGMSGGPSPFTQEATAHPSTFPNNSSFNWSVPTPNGCGGSVCGFLHEDYANYLCGPQSITPKQISAISTFTETHNLSYTEGVSGNGFDILDDLFVAPTSSDCTQGDQLAEVSVFYKSPTSTQTYINSQTQLGTVTISGVLWKAAVNNSVTPKVLLLAPNNYADVLTGTVDILAVLNYFVAQGQLSSSGWILGYGLGVEPYQGAGSLTYNSFSNVYS